MSTKHAPGPSVVVPASDWYLMLSALRRAFEYLDNIPETSAGGDDEAVEIARAAKVAIKQAMVVAP